MIICGIAFCLLAKAERRYPDDSRLTRVIVLVGGILMLAFGLFSAFMGPKLWFSLTPWGRYLVSRLLDGPWFPLTMSVFGSAFVLGTAKRANSRRLLALSQLPAWPAGAGLLVWATNMGRIVPLLPSLIWDWLVPVSMIVMLVPAIRTLLRGAREADSNWVTDV